MKSAYISALLGCALLATAGFAQQVQYRVASLNVGWAGPSARRTPSTTAVG